MDFELSEDQALLQAGLRALLEGACPISHVREAAVEKFDPDHALWSVLAENGWTGLTIPEKHAGAGLGFEEAMIVSREAGRALLHQPLTETIIASRALERHGATERHLAALRGAARGERRLTLALRDAPEAPGDEKAVVRAEPRDEGWRVRGTARAVPHGPGVHSCLVEARLLDEARMLFLLDTEQRGVRWVERSPMDRTVRRFDLELDDASVEADAAMPAFTRAAPEIERILDEWRVLLAAENEGACRRMLEMSVAYVAQREQFGRPVGANQAVKVRIAEMGAAVERMTAAIYHAAMKIDQDAPDAALAAAMAKNAAGVPASFVATQAIHVHGALGFTWEQDVHLFAKRVKSNELTLGGERESLARIAAALLDEV